MRERISCQNKGGSGVGRIEYAKGKVERIKEDGRMPYLPEVKLCLWPALIPPSQPAAGPLITRVTTLLGVTPEGADTTNEMTFIFMDGKIEIGLNQPALAVRLHSQTQFNIIDRENLVDAQVHLEKYSDLVARVAGQAAYFVDLSKPLQDQIIERTELSLAS